MFIKRLRMKNLLSFRDTTVELGPLNVLIGANGSGKSNLIEVIGLLQAAPENLQRAVVAGGGARMWISLAEGAGQVATIEADFAVEDASGGLDGGDVSYELSFTALSDALSVVSENLVNSADKAVLFTRSGGAIYIRGDEGRPAPPAESVFALYRDPREQRVTPVGRTLARIAIYREFLTTGRYAQSRYGIVPSSVPVRGTFLQEGGDNLALVLHQMDFRGLQDRISRYLKRLSERFEGVKVRVGQVAQTYLQETGLLEPLPAIRMSDGTLKFLCLLAVLLDLDLPELLCLEEPEVGLHPDAVRIVADLLVEASKRTQLIVTTHSEALVDALSDQPEAVLVCERDFDNGTQFRRLNSERLSVWLERYTLGQLWRKGEIGGTRW
jgi:predicted ATPase